MNWFWPRELKEDDRLIVRIVRLVHWCICGFALFGLVVTLIALFEGGEPEPIAFVTIVSLWLSLALLGRAVRYIVVRE